jgi:hypothetical protein
MTGQPGVVVKNEIIIFCTDAFAEAFGLRREDLIGKPGLNFFQHGPAFETQAGPGSSGIAVLDIKTGPHAERAFLVEVSTDSDGDMIRLLSAIPENPAGAVNRRESRKRVKARLPSDSPTNVNEVLDELLAQTWQSVVHASATVDRDYGLLPAVRAGRRDLSRILLRMVVLAERAALTGDAITIRTRSDGERAIVVIRGIRQDPPRTTAAPMGGPGGRDAVFDLPDDRECETLLAPYGGMLAMSIDNSFRATLTIPIHSKVLPEIDVRERDLTTVQWTP